MIAGPRGAPRCTDRRQHSGHVRTCTHRNTGSPAGPRSANFDRNSGIWLERLVFNHRRMVMVFVWLLTAAVGLLRGNTSSR